VSCLWTSRTISIPTIREDFVGESSGKVKPAYNRSLETIHEKNEEETETISEENKEETIEENMEGEIIAKKAL
jgi:hypothetical protein